MAKDIITVTTGFPEGSEEPKINSSKKRHIEGVNGLNTRQENERITNKPYDDLELLYRVEDDPALPVTVIFTLQMAALNVSFCIAMTVLIGGAVCADSEMITKISSATLFMSGVTTLLQTTFGVRLPIFQGPNSVFLVPILNMADFPDWKCPTNSTIGAKVSSDQNITIPYDDGPDVLSSTTRIQMFQGGLLVASIIHMVLGGSGLMGRAKRYIGPLTIAPTIGLVGVVMIESAINLASTHWGIAVFTMLVFLIMTLYLEHARIPVPTWSKDRGCHLTPYPVFHVYAIVVTIVLGCGLSWILTATGVLTDDPNAHGYKARIDSKLDVIQQAHWFHFPYPGQFGPPIFSLSIFTGMLLTVIMSIVESVGDYITVARICGVPRPPAHAINRGLFVEGLGSVISSLLGTSHGTTSYSQMIGIIGLTKVGSRIIFQLGGLVLVILGVLGKVSAVFVSIPDAVIGGITLMSMGGLTGVAFSSLHSVNLKITRNFITVGLAFIMGIFVPEAIRSHSAVIDTGVPDLDQFLIALLTNGPFVGAFVGFFLDNTLPGERSQHRERSRSIVHQVSGDEGWKLYGLPWIPQRLFTGKWTRFVPCLPHYKVPDAKVNVA